MQYSLFLFVCLLDICLVSYIFCFSYMTSNFLFIIYYLCVSKKTMCRIHKSIIYSVLRYCSKFFFSCTSLLSFHLERNVFHLFPCNFRQSYCGFLKKTLSFFLMVFDGNSTLFIPVISEKSKFANLSYVYKNDKNLTKLATFLSITLLDTAFSCSFIYKINCYPVI